MAGGSYMRSPLMSERKKRQNKSTERKYKITTINENVDEKPHDNRSERLIYN